MIMNNLVLDIVLNNSWEDVLNIMSERKIKVKEKGNLAIFNYDIDADFNDELVCQCRGIIIDKHEKKVVCRGFDKFFNFSEPHAVEIDWNNASVQEKIDGSIIKLYHYSDTWYWATNGMIDASDANVADGLMADSFQSIIEGCKNYPFIKKLCNTLNKSNTYIFELVSPFNRVVISYDESMLYHIGTRNNYTGEEYDIDIGVIKPKQFPLNTLNDCIVAASLINQGHEQVEAEGFVVVDKDFNRIKIKSPEYVFMHHNINNYAITIKRIVDLLSDEDFNLDSFLNQFPEYIERFDAIKKLIDDFHMECINEMNGARLMYEECGDRRKVWEEFGLNKETGFIAMRAVGNDIPVEELLNHIEKKHLVKHIRNALEGDDAL